jgi:hypothetical protein
VSVGKTDRDWDVCGGFDVAENIRAYPKPMLCSRALVLLSMGIGIMTVAGVAGPFFLTGSQELVIVEAIGKMRIRPGASPPGYRPRIGDVLPTSIALRPLPKVVTNRVPGVMGHFYAALPHQALIVSGTGRRVVGIIER